MQFGGFKVMSKIPNYLNTEGNVNPQKHKIRYFELYIKLIVNVWIVFISFL